MAFLLPAKSLLLLSALLHRRPSPPPVLLCCLSPPSPPHCRAALLEKNRAAARTAPSAWRPLGLAGVCGVDAGPDGERGAVTTVMRGCPPVTPDCVTEGLHAPTCPGPARGALQWEGSSGGCPHLPVSRPGGASPGGGSTLPCPHVGTPGSKCLWASFYPSLLLPASLTQRVCSGERRAPLTGGALAGGGCSHPFWSRLEPSPTGPSST